MLDQYTVNEYVSVYIVRGADGVLTYVPVEPPLSDNDRRAVEAVKQALATTRVRIDEVLREGRSSRVVEQLAREVIERRRIPVDNMDAVMYYLKRDLVGYGPLDPMLSDPLIEDVHVDGPGTPVYVWHSRWESLKTVVALSDEELSTLVWRLSALTGKQVSLAEPILEALLPEGYRLELVIPPVSPRGPSMTIRKYFTHPITLIDMVNLGTISPEAVAYLWLMIDYGRNIVIIGPTGAGKTTLLNALLYLVNPTAKIITIEDTREINILHEHWQPLLTRPSTDPSIRNVDTYTLLEVAMRSRPQYVVVGEVRGGEAYTLFQAFASGHSGMTTMHAETVEDAIKRLITKPMNVPPMLVGFAHIFIRIMIVQVGGRITRRVVEIVENLGMTKSGPRLNTVFRWDPDRDVLVKVSESRMFEVISRARFVPIDRLREELERREELIRFMAIHGFTGPAVVRRIFSSYHIKPIETLEAVRRGEIP